MKKGLNIVLLLIIFILVVIRFLEKYLNKHDEINESSNEPDLGIVREVLTSSQLQVRNGSNQSESKVIQNGASLQFGPNEIYGMSVSLRTGSGSMLLGNSGDSIPLSENGTNGYQIPISSIKYSNTVLVQSDANSIIDIVVYK